MTNESSIFTNRLDQSSNNNSGYLGGKKNAHNHASSVVLTPG